MRFFNITGPTNSRDHYFVEHRLDDSGIRKLIEQKLYFVLYAPRQSGKTTAIKDLVRNLNQEGIYTALYINTESSHVAVNDTIRAVRELLYQVQEQIQKTIPNERKALDFLETLIQKPTEERFLYDFLRYWAENSPKPLVLFFDEFDALVGESLIALLKQFRAGFQDRPQHFPQTIGLVGVRDLRDYKMITKVQREMESLFSPFNIKADSLTLPNFSLAQVRNLYLQHSTDTGQHFTDEAIEYAFYLTQGQPWLVNALAYQACFRDVEDRTQPITKEIIERSKETLIRRRDTHIDSLLDRLDEERVRNIVDTIVSGGEIKNFPQRDVSYVTDLGLIKKDSFQIANPIYQEIIPRELTAIKQRGLTFERSWYIKPDGLLDMPKFLAAFTQFFREGSADWLSNFDYQESGPHLLVMAYLQRVINGGGSIHREYALGRKRVDLLIIWPAQQPQQRIVIEIKIFKDSNTLPRALEQTAEYMDINNATEGHIVIFDRNSNKSWDEKIYNKMEVYNGKTIDVWGM